MIEKSCRINFVVCALFIVCGIFVVQAPGRADTRQSVLTIVERDGERAPATAAQDVLKIRRRGNELALVVGHKRGIGYAAIEKSERRWPRDVRLVFSGFKALEGIEVEQGTRSVKGFAKNGKSGDDGQGGLSYAWSKNSISVRLPEGFLHDGDRRFTVRWVDFYRQ